MLPWKHTGIFIVILSRLDYYKLDYLLLLTSITISFNILQILNMYRPKPTTCNVTGLKPENVDKNRHPDICPGIRV